MKLDRVSVGAPLPWHEAPVRSHHHPVGCDPVITGSRALPVSWYPHVFAAFPAPMSIDPEECRTRWRRNGFDTRRRRRTWHVDDVDRRPHVHAAPPARMEHPHAALLRPVCGHEYLARARFDPVTRLPDIVGAVPAPMAADPVITRRRRRRWSFDPRRRRCDRYLRLHDGWALSPWRRCDHTRREGGRQQHQYRSTRT